MLAIDVALERICGPETIGPDDPAWNAVVAIASPLPRGQPGQIEELILPHIDDLVRNGPTTLNLQRLVCIVCELVGLPGRRAGPYQDASTGNTVLVLTSLLRRLIEAVEPERLVAYVELPDGVREAAAAVVGGDRRGGVELGAHEGDSSDGNIDIGLVGAADQPPRASKLAAALAGVAWGALGARPEPDTSRGVEEERDLAPASRELPSLAQALTWTVLEAVDARLPTESTSEYWLAMQLLELLVVLLSTRLRHISPIARPGDDPFADAAAEGWHLARGATSSLLEVACSAPQPPLGLRYRLPSSSRGAVDLLRGAVSSFLRLPFFDDGSAETSDPSHRPSAPGDPAAPPGTPTRQLARTSLGTGPARRASSHPQPTSPIRDTALLALLTLHFWAPEEPCAVGNPYRATLRHLVDGDEDPGGDGDKAEAGLPTSHGDAAFSYSRLYRSLGPLCATRSGALLAYALLHGCRGFRIYCAVRSDPETLLAPLAGALWRASRGPPTPHLHTLLSLVLMLSHDPVWAAGLFHLLAPRESAVTAGASDADSVAAGEGFATCGPGMPIAPPHGAHSSRGEAPQHATSLGDLAVRSLARAAACALRAPPEAEMRLSALGALGNLLPHSTGLAPETAARLLTLHAALAKRFATEQVAMEAGGSPSSVAAGAAGAALAPQWSYERALLVLLRALDAALADQGAANPDLLYALLRDASAFLETPVPRDGRRAAARLSKLVHLVQVAADAALGEGGSGDAEDVMQAVRSAAATASTPRARDPPPSFEYVEGESPEAFFVPYVWSLALDDPSLAFDAAAVRLFDVDEAACAGDEAQLAQLVRRHSEAAALEAGVGAT